MGHINRKNRNFSAIDFDSEEKTGFDAKLELDERDSKLLALVHKDPNISQENLASILKLSQPSVGARLRKLREKGVLNNTYGVNFKKVDLNLAKIDVNATDTQSIISEFKDCPFFLNAFITSGRHNLCLLFCATDLKRLEGIVNYHLRGNPKVKEVEMNIVISVASDFILPLNVDYQNKRQANCKQYCAMCDKDKVCDGKKER